MPHDLTRFDPKGRLTPAQLLNGIATILQSSNSEETRRAFAEDMRRFFEVDDLKEVSPEQVLGAKTKDVLDWRDRMMEEGLAAATIRRRISSLSKFYRALTELKLIDVNPVNSLVRLPPVSSDQQATPALTLEEVAKIVAVPDRKTWIGARDYCILRFAYHFGLRRAELARIMVDDIRPNERGVLGFTVVIKRGKYRHCEFTKEPEEAYRGWLAKRGTQSGALFCAKGRTTPMDESSIWDVIHRAAVKAGVQRQIVGPTGKTHWYVHPHTFRATTITSMVDAGIPPGDVAQFIVHGDVATTLRYTRGKAIDRVKMGEALTLKKDRTKT